MAILVAIRDPASPNFILTRGSPPSKPQWTTNLPCKERCISRNLRIQQHKMSLRMSLIKKVIPTRFKAFTTMVLLTLTTNHDGGALVTTQRTHFYLILFLILRGSRITPVRSNMRWNMVPWSMRRVAHLPRNAKPRKIKKYALTRLTAQRLLHQMSLTKPQCHKRANNCSMCAHATHVHHYSIVAGLSKFMLSSNEWHKDMNPAFLSTIMAPNFKTKEIASGMRKTIPVPNEKINGCPGGHIHTMLPNILTATVTLKTCNAY